ncbi:MAG: DapH/DapD/GlmU-related protein [Alphaproteobacteria bacterium]
MTLSMRRYLANAFCALLPPTRLYPLKAWVWRRAGVDAHPSAMIVSSVRIQTMGPVRIGARAFLGHETLLVGGDAPIEIGADADVSTRVVLMTGTHAIDAAGPRTAGAGLSRPITIGAGAWIGVNATVLGGVRVGNKALIAAGSVVTRSVPERTVAAGVPCRVKRSLDEAPEDLERQKGPAR